MPIRIADNLPARRTLESEGVIVMGETEAARQDIRPLRIALLNLMPDKITTETQIARVLGATPLQVELELLRISDHVSKNTSAGHIAEFYRPWTDVRAERFDGLIVTGAPVEQIPFEEVTYWDELRHIFDWSQVNVHRTLNVCWGAMAALHHFHGVPKHTLEEKAFGVYRHHNRKPSSVYLNGFSDNFEVPVSRWTEIRIEDIRSVAELDILLDSDETGVCLVQEKAGNRLYIFNHVEYDSTSLADEYFRDVSAGVPIKLPKNYFPHNDPSLPPQNRWRGHAHLLFGNWINEIYQTTPYDLQKIGTGA